MSQESVTAWNKRETPVNQGKETQVKGSSIEEGKLKLIREGREVMAFLWTG